MSDEGFDPRSARQRIQTLLSLDRDEEAITELQRAIAAQPERAEWWCLMTLARLSLGAHDLAVHAAERAVALGPDEEWPHRVLSISYRVSGRFREAVAEARVAVSLQPFGWQAHVALAEGLLHATPDRTEARVEAQRACELGPNVADTHLTLGRVLLAAGQTQEAEAAYREALRIDPNNTTAHNNLAIVSLRKAGTPFRRSHHLADAAEGFATAVRTNPRSGLSRRNIDVVVNAYMYRISFLLFVVAWFSGLFVSRSTAPSTLARAAPVALLVIPGVFVTRFVLRLSPPLRGVLWSSIRRSLLFKLAVVADVCAGLLIVVAAFASADARAGLFGLAYVLAAVGGILVLVDRSRRRRPAATPASPASPPGPGPPQTPPPIRAELGVGEKARGRPLTWQASPVPERDYAVPAARRTGVGTPVLGFVVGSLLLVALFGLVLAAVPSASLGARWSGVVLVAVFGGGAALVLRVIRRRRRQLAPRR